MSLPIEIINASKSVRAFQQEHEMTRCCAQAMALFKAYTPEFDVKVVSGVIKFFVEGREYELEHIWGVYEGEIIELVPEWYKKQSKIRYYSLEQWLKVNRGDKEVINICVKQCVGLKKSVLNLVENFDAGAIKLAMLDTHEQSNRRFQFIRQECRRRGLVPNQRNISDLELELQREYGLNYFE
jgi:hypothetical protein